MFTNNQPANSRERSVTSNHSKHEPIQNNDDDTTIPEIGDMDPGTYLSLLPEVTDIPDIIGGINKTAVSYGSRQETALENSRSSTIPRTDLTQ